MSRKLLFLTLAILLATIIFGLTKSKQSPKTQVKIPAIEERTWQIKSIDTMKYSRDLAQEVLNDPTFDQTIDFQVKAIAQTNATHVAVATPYDQEFYPILKRWVEAARRHGLSVWFRGNFSAWEGWFVYDKNLTRQMHLELTRKFIQDMRAVFESGDIFSPCPECENGGAGDPRITGDLEGFRKFMIAEHQAAEEEFKKIGKMVATNFASMNWDVARLVMDRETSAAMDDLVVIDHYAASPEKLANDIESLQKETGAKIVLGEIGAPIPDITGPLDPHEHARWLDQALKLISLNEAIIGLNYWVAVGGQTALFDDDHSPKPAAEIIKKYFSLTKLD